MSIYTGRLTSILIKTLSALILTKFYFKNWIPKKSVPNGSFLPIPRYGSKLDFHPSFFPLAFFIEHCLQVDRSDEFVKIERCGNIVKLKSAVEVDMLPSDRGDISWPAHFKWTVGVIMFKQTGK